MQKISKDTSFSYSELLLIAAIMILGIFLRWYLLDQRAIHHDESLHGLYGKYFWLDPATKFYKYNPLLHGPVLYNTLPWVYDLLGISKFSIRALSAAIGSLFVFVPLFFRRYLSNISLLVLITYISLSPSLVFWSRYIRHDPFVLLFMLLMLAGFIARPKYRLLIILPAFSLQMCTKENSFITLSLLLGYLAYDFLIKRRSGLYQHIILHLKNHYKSFLLGTAIATIIYVYFYSAGFRYGAGILDGLYRKSLSYWINQHSIERIKGPFSFQFLVLSWYELLFIAATIIHMIHFYSKCCWRYRAAIVGSIIAAIICHFTFKETNLAQHFLWSALKFKINLDFYLFLIIPTHAIVLTTYYIKKSDFQLSFWGYLFFATLFSYSFVGERVPWLALYPLTTGLIFLVLYFQKHLFEHLFHRREHQLFSIAVATICFTLVFRITVLTNFTNAGSPDELINQVHTSNQFEQKIYQIKNELIQNKKLFHCDKIAIWPTSWLLYGIPGYQYGAKPKNEHEFDFLIGKHNDYEKMLRLKTTHNVQPLLFRSWWVPRYRELNWKNFLKYALTHKPWNLPGDLKVAFYTKKKGD